MIIEGRVKVARVAVNGKEVVMDIYRFDQFFGETVLVTSALIEKAVAVEATQLMMWDVDEIAAIILQRPNLGIALLRLLTERNLHFAERIEILSTGKVIHRLAWSLLRFADNFGKKVESGAVEMIPLTHGLLADYIGTSREIVTSGMNQLRREGYLRYSRGGILLKYRPPTGETLQK